VRASQPQQSRVQAFGEILRCLQAHALQVHRIAVAGRLPQCCPDGTQLVAAGLRVGLQPRQRFHQHLLDLVEVTAQRIVRQAAIGAERCQRRCQRLRRVALLAPDPVARRQQLREACACCSRPPGTGPR
jgi:hypothetical protein